MQLTIKSFPYNEVKYDMDVLVLISKVSACSELQIHDKLSLAGRMRRNEKCPRALALRCRFLFALTSPPTIRSWQNKGRWLPVLQVCGLSSEVWGKVNLAHESYQMKRKKKFSSWRRKRQCVLLIYLEGRRMLPMLQLVVHFAPFFSFFLLFSVLFMFSSIFIYLYFV